MDDLIKKTAKKLVLAKNVAALTGAGISVESNIPPFRGPGGIWEKIDPMQYAHIDAFIKDPVKVCRARNPCSFSGNSLSKHPMH